MRNLLYHGLAVETGLALGTKTHHAFNERKEGVISTEAHIFAGQNTRATLAHDNRTGLCFLSGIELRTEIFRIRIFQVFCGSSRLSMCHRC